MQRIFKFRAWNNGRKKMTKSWSLVELIENGSEWGVAHNKRANMADFDFAIMQFTGLKDKNGKGQETYHQDILRVGDGYCGDHLEQGGNFIIEWVDDGWVVVNKEGTFLCTLFEAIYNRGAEVIGNVWENPELLEDK